MTPRPKRNALVTGASKRIGRALSIALAKEGMGVAVHYRTSEKEAHSLVALLRQMGTSATALQEDLTKLDAAHSLLVRATRELGAINCLINNAAIWPSSQLMTCELDELTAPLSANAVAPLFLTRAFAASADAGMVLNLLDCRITDYDASNVAYHLSKRMLTDITRLTALELAPRIRVNGVAPGLILPPASADHHYLELRRNTNPLERIGSMDDITEAALFLLRSPFITGQILFVDGGRNLGGAVY